MAVPSGMRSIALLSGGAALVLAGGIAAASLAHPDRTAGSATPNASAVLDSCIAAAASPSPPSPSPSPTSSPSATIPVHDASGGYSRALIDSQDRLMAVATPIVDLADPDEGDRSRLDPVAEAGLAGISIDSASSTLHLAWKGPLPDDVQRILRGAPAAVHVDLRAAPCSQQQLLAGQQAVVRASRGLQSRLGVVIQTVSAGTDGQGLTVEYSLSGGRADPGSAAVLAALRPLVRVPVLTA